MDLINPVNTSISMDFIYVDSNEYMIILQDSRSLTDTYFINIIINIYY